MEESFQVDGRTVQFPAQKDKGDFKNALDVFLMSVPDQPRMASLVPAATCQRTGRPSNSLLAWATWRGDTT